MKAWRRYLMPALLALGTLTAWVAGAGAGSLPPAPPATEAAPAPPATEAAPAPETRGTIELAQLLALAEQHSLELQLAALQVPRADNGLDQAVAAGAAGGQALAQALQQRFGAPLPPEPAGAAALRQAAQLGVEQAALGQAAARQGVRMAVIRAYVEWQKALALADAQRAGLTRATAQLETARVSVAAGTAASYDVIQAQAQVAAQRAAVVGADAAAESTRLALERTVGAPIAPDLRPAAALPAADDVADLPPTDTLVDQALAQRPEVAIARLGVAMKATELDLLGQYLPADDPGMAGALLAVREADLQREAAQADVRLELRQAVLGVRSARARLEALGEGEVQAREALRLAQLRFAAGAATSLEVIGAQAALTQAESNRIQAAADLSAALAALQRATGGL